jgi:hypothetical protein
MCANRIVRQLSWLGGGEPQEADKKRERSDHLIAGVVVLLGASLAWLVTTLAVAGSTSWPVLAIVALTFVFGVLIAALGRAIGSGEPGWGGILGRATVAVAVGVLVGELAAVALFSGPVDRLLDEQAARSADASPSVAQATADLERTRQARTALDTAVAQAREQREQALVVARCESNPSPACPQTHITGVPGTGPETRTANGFLGDAQRQLDNAVVERDRLSPSLDAQVAADEVALTEARESPTTDTRGGVGARWAAMNEYTLGNAGALVLRALTVAFCVLLYLLPLVLRLWRGKTSQDRAAAARAEVERAELEADTAIAVKRAEVRAAVETMWAEQRLASARMAVEAQAEIDREEQRRRVVEALEAPVSTPSERVFEPVAELPAQAATQDRLPARAEAPREGGGSLIPSIPDVTKAAARWVRPFVPPIVASAIETTTKPLRGARQIFEETEEIHISLRRTHKVTVQSEQSEPAPTRPETKPRWVESSTVEHLQAEAEQPPLEPATARRDLTRREGPAELPPAE